MIFDKLDNLMVFWAGIGAAAFARGGRGADEESFISFRLGAAVDGLTEEEVEIVVGVELVALS